MFDVLMMSMMLPMDKSSSNLTFISNKRKHYALLFADHKNKIQAKTIHPLLVWLHDKQFHSHEFKISDLPSALH
jgi:hypothetical protein